MRNIAMIKISKSPLLIKHLQYKEIRRREIYNILVLVRCNVRFIQDEIKKTHFLSIATAMFSSYTNLLIQISIQISK